MRDQLIGFDPTETEFRDLYQRMEKINSSYEFEDTNDPAVQQSRAADEAAALDEFKAQLAPDRAAQLAKSEDPDYRSLASLSEQYDLPEATADAVVDIRQTAEDERRQLLATRDISAEQMDAALKAIQAETERVARQALGDKAYTQYASGADWIRKLGSEPGN